MTKEEFIQKHGEIKIEKEQETYFSRLKHPAFISDQWIKHSFRDKGTKVFNGKFYNIGYYRFDENPFEIEHNWDALDYEIDLTSKIVSILRTNQCFALGSEGDGIFYPFIFQTVDSDFFPDDNALGVIQPKDVAEAYRTKKIQKTYHDEIVGFDIENEISVFWDEDKEDTMQNELSPECYKAYIEVSKIMKSELSHLTCIHYYSDYIEFPVVYGGIDKYGRFIGVISSLVWT